MIPKVINLVCMCVISMSALAATHIKTATGVKVVVGETAVELDFYSAATVNVVKYPTSFQDISKESYSIIAKPVVIPFKVETSGNRTVIKTSELRILLDNKSGQLTFYTSGGKKLCQEKATKFTPSTDAGHPCLNVSQSFTIDKDEPIYGLGNYENGKLSQRGVSHKLMPGNVEDGIPLIQSVKGYGILWDNYSPTDFSDVDNEITFSSEVGECIDYYFMYGKNADGVISEIRELSGRVPMFPLWTYGYWQSRERYKTQEETVGVVKKYRELDVPLDGIIQDWRYWDNNYQWNAMEFLNPEFDKPEEMISEIHDNNAHVIISIWSSFGPMTKAYRELDTKGLLFNFLTWPQSGIADVWPPRMDYPSGVRVYDAYSPEARNIYWKNLSRLHDLNIDGWWMDSTEPDHFDPKPEDYDIPTYLGSFRKVRNAYPLMTVGGVYDHQRAVDSTKRVFILTRSGYIGQQRYGCNVWSGDVVSSWEMLRNQIPAALNFVMTGNPNVNSDIGGFFSGGYYHHHFGESPKNPRFQELYTRWMQFGAFSPMMRSHGTDIKREIYYFGEKGEPAYDAIEDAIRLRYSLLPYIYSSSWNVTNDHSTLMRPLPMDFANDHKVWDMNDEFMFGDALLVAPVVEAQYTQEIEMDVDENTGWDRKEVSASKDEFTVPDFLELKPTVVYLPAGSDWYDYWTNEMYKGGKTISKKVALKDIPMYVRSGSIVPIGPDVQYATEKPWDSLTINVYAGTDGSFNLYEDEFDNYNYEKGAYSIIPFEWDEKTKTLHIGQRKGSYPGMLSTRNFHVKLIDNANSKPRTREYDVVYSGAEVNLAVNKK